jgi:hypothetical protein
MTEALKRLINTLLAIDIGIVFLCWMAGERSWLYSSQIGYWSAVLVIGGSMMGYRRMVTHRLLAGDIPTNDPDRLDRIDDPHDLYGDHAPQTQAPKELASSAETLKEKNSLKRRSVGEVVKDSRAFLSLYRVVAYVLFIVGFLFLQRQDLLSLTAYLLSVSVPPVAMVLILLRKAKSTEYSKA